MASLHLLCPFVHIFIQLAIICGINGEQRDTINQAPIGSIQAQVYHLNYLYPFQNCTTMIFINKNLVWDTIMRPSSGPIILLSYDTKISLAPGVVIVRKFSKQMRRNSVPHCWATFTILPENEYLTLNRHHPDFISHQPFMEANVWSQYFILVTAVPDVIQTYVKSEQVSSRLRQREVIIVDITHVINNGPKLKMHYYNIYYIKNPTVGMGSSEQWYQIDCLPSDCFKHLIATEKNVSNLNKYFWASYASFGSAHKVNVRKLFGHTDIGPIQHSTLEYRRLANLTTFHGFLSFWVLQDMIEHNFSNCMPLHFITPIQGYGLSAYGRFNFIIYDVHQHSYVSCYQVSSNSDILNALTSPLDGLSWTLLSTCFVTVVLILTGVFCASTSTVSSDRIFLVVGLTLESSVLLSRSIYEARFLRSRHELIGLYSIISVWILLVGTILTNWYKSWFTMEMIVPRTYKSPWTNVMDVEGFRILMPFSLVDEYDSLKVPTLEHFLYQDFYSKLHYRFLRKSLESVNYKRLVAHQNIAKRLFSMLQPYFGLDENMRPGIFAYRVGTPPVYNKSALQDYPIQPIEYNTGDTFEIARKLASCGKVALMDSKENIATITNFLNDNQKRRRYVNGDDDFFTEIRGWTFFPVRNSYAEERLKIMISSGIFAHWESLYKLWKPKKLLNHYANWSHPKVEAASRLDFDSKIITGFYVCGFCLLICIVSLRAEVETFLDKARQTEILAARMAELISGMNLTSPSIEITAYGGGKEKSVADFFWTRFSDRYDFPQKLESMGPLAIKIRIFPQLSSFNKAEIGIRVMIDGHAYLTILLNVSTETFLEAGRQSEILAAKLGELISGMNLSSSSIEITAFGM
ncbi:hypothetical protein Fcan01_24267 [Folsomia candida]|uniref:Uncharacterized protein n=1 Tax=Folsomia candida TaxID=158441 RepID=A0A226D9V9_FOLCA|nr:hypothetical protein Fcan01_24267 [Folsomia candida]